MGNWLYGQTQSQRSPVFRHSGAGRQLHPCCSIAGRHPVGAWPGHQRAGDTVTDPTAHTHNTQCLAHSSRRATPAGHRFDEIDAELDALTELRDKPAGAVRITCGDHVLRTTLLPRLTPLLVEYPDIKVEFDVNYGFRDIVADRFDAGVRLGDTIDKDMIAMSIGPPLRMAVVASSAYFAVHSKPTNPRDLMNHNCINMRMQSGGGLYV